MSCSICGGPYFGPYFTSSSVMSAKFIIVSLVETMHCLHLYSFETKGILCDGASTNLCATKLLTGFGSGAFGLNMSLENKHSIKTWFHNPHQSKDLCPHVSITPGNTYKYIYYACISQYVYDPLFILSFFPVKEHGGCIVLVTENRHQICHF